MSGPHVRPAAPADDDRIADLFAEYQEAFAFDLGDQDVAAEGRQARTFYASGALLVADINGEVAGCVAYEPWGDGRARMKRMFVSPRHRGHGLGRALAMAIMDRARADGHAVMVLDTTAAMAAATELYRSLGFEEFEPDYVAPCRETVYLSRPL